MRALAIEEKTQTTSGKGMIKRRRLIQIAAMSLAAPYAVHAETTLRTWRGRALGAEATIQLPDDGPRSKLALKAALDTLRRMETLFSLYDPGSVLNQLNLMGRLEMPPEFAALMDIVDQLYTSTHGLFDPTIQPRWSALARTGRTDNSVDQIGWHKVRRVRQTLAFEESEMALTLNGVAQGFATDRVFATLEAHGYGQLGVNIGEYRSADDGLSLEVVHHGQTLPVALSLRHAAAATSDMSALTFSDGTSHILHPQGEDSRKLQAVTVVADTAALADGYSTALCLDASHQRIQELMMTSSIHQIITSDGQRGRDYSEKGMTAFSMSG